ncbi:hypothetical protein [Legionella tunisiensis]|uniref:hypothetical protein n=1 Tax=Legionella tunisiensis TaxID=1034944 RepID=UPI00035ECF08|nr:hypothetical protein [Legionella tunisiensis]
MYLVNKLKAFARELLTSNSAQGRQYRLINNISIELIILGSFLLYINFVWHMWMMVQLVIAACGFAALNLLILKNQEYILVRTFPHLAGLSYYYLGELLDGRLIKLLFCLVLRHSNPGSRHYKLVWLGYLCCPMSSHGGLLFNARDHADLPIIAFQCATHEFY